MKVTNIEFEAGYIIVTFDHNRKVRYPIAPVLRAEDIPVEISSDTEVSAHAELATGVHGAGLNTLATDDDITTHATDAAAHHAKYTNGEAVNAMGVKADDNPLHHDRYADSEAVTAMGVKADNNPLHHDRYTDNEAVTAMGVEADDNPLNHDRYADSEAVAAVEAAGSITVDVTGDLTGNADTATEATQADGVKEAIPVNAVASILQTNLTGDENDLKYTAQTKGVAGDDISVEYLDPGTPSATLSVGVVGSVITVNLATNAGTKASANIGSGGNGTVTITDDDVGVQGNSNTVQVVLGETPSGALAATIDAGAIEVTLGMDGGTKATGRLTVSGVVIDEETVTLGGDEVYEFDIDGDVTGTHILVDISAHAAKAKGTAAFTGSPSHNETFVIDADTFTIKLDGDSGAHKIDLSQCATAKRGTGAFGLGSLPADTETITINSRVYEFDTDSSITGHVAIDISTSTTVDEVIDEIVTAINGDGSADVTAVADHDENRVVVTSKLYGTVGNYAVLEACGAGGWLTGANLVNGANPTATEVIDQIIADFDGLTCTVTKKDAGAMYVEYKQGGIAGNSITFTEDLTNVTFDGESVLGGTTAGAECSNLNALAVLETTINDETTKPVTATDNEDGTLDLEYDTPGTAGNSFATGAIMANGSWGEVTLEGGVNIAPDDAKNTATLVAGAVNDLSGVGAAASGSGADPLTGIEGPTSFTGGIDPAITSTAALVEAAVEAKAEAAALVAVENKSGNNGTGVVTAMTEANLAGGVNGTVGSKGEVKEGIDTGTAYLYVAIADNTVAGNNWRRVALGNVY